VFFYSGRTALLWNGRFNNLEYGSYAPNAPPVFIGDAELVRLWSMPQRCYLIAYAVDMPKIRALLTTPTITVESGDGKVLLTNHPLH
jgi:hypothetical protein